MSKSDANVKSRIDLTDSPDMIYMKFKKAVSDSRSVITYDPVERPAVSNIIDIYSSVTEQTAQDACSEFANMDTVAFKAKVAEAVIEELNPIRMEYERLIEDSSHIQRVLDTGRDRAICIAEKTLLDVMKLMGLR